MTGLPTMPLADAQKGSEGVAPASQSPGHQPSASALRASQSGVPNAAPERVRREAYAQEIVRRRKLNNIPDGFLTPNWLELAIAKDWTLVNGQPSETRANAEREAMRSMGVLPVKGFEA